MLDLKLPVIDGAALLDRLKHHPATRHIPVHIVSGGDGRQQALRAGAVAFLEKPVAREGLEDAFASLATFIDRGVRNLLVVEDDENQRKAIVELVGVGDDVNVVAVGSSDEALAALEATRFDCMVLDLKLPGKGGFALLERVKKSERAPRRAGDRLHRQGPHAPGGDAPEASTRRRSSSRTSAHPSGCSTRPRSSSTASSRSCRPSSRRMLEQLHSADAVFQGRKILIVDDDVRNVFALTSVLESHGMEVVYARERPGGAREARGDTRTSTSS